MIEELGQVESRLRRVDDVLVALERRVAALESQAAMMAAAAVPADVPADAFRAVSAAPPAERLDVGGVLSVVGRTFMVFGGAFLLRALTDAGVLPHGAGIVLGIVYALGWLAAADRSAAAGRPTSALFHGATAVAVTLPLLWEAMTHFALLQPTAGAIAVGLFTAAALAVAWRRGLQGVAAAATLGAIGFALASFASTGQFISFTVLLIGIGIAALWLGYSRDWFWLRWPAALVADVAVIGLTTRAVSGQHLEATGAVIAVQLLLLAAYLGSFGARTMIRGRLVIPFEVVQTVAALGVGLGGAVAVARATGGGETPLGVASLLLGAGCYAAAFAFVGRRLGLGANFYFYATLALVLTATGCTVLMGPAPLSLAFAMLAVLAAWLASRLSRLALVMHAAVYSTGAALVSGLLGTALAAFAGVPAAWPSLRPTAWLALVAAWACLLVPRPRQFEAPESVAGIPRLLLALVAVAGTGAAIVTSLGPSIAGAPPDGGALATLRTAVLAVSAVALACAARVDRGLELSWLLYPALAVGGLKLLAEDIRQAHAGTLFLSLALFGAALIVAPRLVPRTARHAGGADPGAPAAS